jgi:hypothetical protein
MIGTAVGSRHPLGNEGPGERYLFVDKRMMPFLHWWFWVFAQGRLRTVSRILAAGFGAVTTAIVVSRGTRSRWWAQLPLATACWALLGKVEGDDPRPPRGTVTVRVIKPRRIAAIWRFPRRGRAG